MRPMSKDAAFAFAETACRLQRRSWSLSQPQFFDTTIQVRHIQVFFPGEVSDNADVAPGDLGIA
jgi:hypothetical protein